MTLDGLAKEIALYLPPAFGAFIGLRWAQNQTHTQKVTGFVGSFGLAVYFGPAVAEILALGPKATIASGILVAVIGMDVIGGLLAVAQKFSASPVETFSAVWATIWKKGQP